MQTVFYIIFFFPAINFVPYKEWKLEILFSAVQISVARFINVFTLCKIVHEMVPHHLGPVLVFAINAGKAMENALLLTTRNLFPFRFS